jgi:hypothetical protein
MNLKHFVKSAGVGILIGVLVLVLGAAGELAWLALGLPGVHRTVVSFAPSIIVATMWSVIGFWWASGAAQRQFMSLMSSFRRCLKTLVIGLCGAAVVILVGWEFGAGPHVNREWVLSVRPLPSARPPAMAPTFHPIT